MINGTRVLNSQLARHNSIDDPRLVLTYTGLQRDKLVQRFFMSTSNAGSVPEVLRIYSPHLIPFNDR